MRAANVLHLVCAVAVAGVVGGCGGSPTAPQIDQVFYLHGGGVIDKNFSWEIYFPPLNRVETPRLPRFVGVGVLYGEVRLSRPFDWLVRSADYTPQQRFISYQSPRQFVFTIHERPDFVELPWPDVALRFEDEVRARGSSFVAARMPFAVANAQARGYLVETKVKSRPDFRGLAHEYLVRSGQRVLLVQVNHGPNIETTAEEIATALRSMLVY